MVWKYDGLGCRFCRFGLPLCAVCAVTLAIRLHFNKRGARHLRLRAKQLLSVSDTLPRGGGVGWWVKGWVGGSKAFFSGF